MVTCHLHNVQPPPFGEAYFYPMTPKKKVIDRRDAANVYASIYDDRYKKVVRMAFIDGVVFADMVKAGAVTPDMIDEDFFMILSDSNHKNDEL